jgi:hypothetical protein
VQRHARRSAHAGALIPCDQVPEAALANGRWYCGLYGGIGRLERTGLRLH